MNPTVFVEDRTKSEDPSPGQYSGNRRLIPDIQGKRILSISPLALAHPERDTIVAELNRILNPNVMDALVADGKIAFEIEVPNSLPDPHIYPVAATDQ